MTPQKFVVSKFAQTVMSLLVLTTSTIAAKADNTRTISFPADESYGTIVDLGPDWNLFEKHPKGIFVAEARGTVKSTTDKALMLTASFPLVDKPDVMKKLPADAFQMISILNLPADDKVFGPLSRLTGLKRLDFEEGDFHDKAFGQLSTLINLEALTVKECFVTGESLTKFGTMKKLKFMSFKKIALDWKLLNKSNTVFPALENLHFTDTNLTDEGLHWLTKMPKLTRLVLDSDAQVTDKGLVELKKIKSLRRVELKQLKVTPDAIIQLKGSGIKHIALVDMKLTAADIQRLKTAMPGTVTFSNRKIDKEKIDLFAPLH
ncbi:MAG: hypothetical protein HYX67_05365 [Candidatus Melainabacteria bacterium]|nr:hypothetical protein [Candidatus Melainabacteria bacterium]